MSGKSLNFFSRAKTVSLRPEEKSSILRALKAFMAFYPFRAREIPIEDTGIFFAHFSPILGEIKGTQLTPEEKGEIQSRLISYMAVHPVRLERSLSEIIRSLKAKFFGLKPPLVLATLVVILTSSGGILYAANDALPGESLYSIKVMVFEELPSLFAYTESSQVKWEATKAENRLIEAERLAVGGMLDKETADLIENDLTERVARVDRWETHAEESYGALAEGIDESLLRVKALAGISLELHEALADTETDIKKAAEDTLVTTESRIAQIRILLSHTEDVPKDTAKDVRKRLRTADRALAEGQQSLRKGQHREAYVLFQEAYVLAVEAEKFLPMQSQNSQ